MKKRRKVPDGGGKPDKINIDHILRETGEAPAGQPAVSGDEDSIEIVLSDEAGEGEGAPETHPSAGQALEEARRENEELKDRYLRAVADLENFRKRVEREREEQRARIAIDLVREILPALDDMDRALEQLEEDPAVQEGIALIRRRFGDALAKMGVEPVEALGECFDPTCHEALAVEPREGFEPNTIIEEIRKGYTLGGRVVRPSLVKVVLAPPEGRSADEGESGEADGTSHRD